MVKAICIGVHQTTLVLIWRCRLTIGFWLARGQRVEFSQSISRDIRDCSVQSTEDQSSTLIRSGKNLFATSSNLGKLFRIRSEAKHDGDYRLLFVMRRWCRSGVTFRGAEPAFKSRAGRAILRLRECDLERLVISVFAVFRCANRQSVGAVCAVESNAQIRRRQYGAFGFRNAGISSAQYRTGCEYDYCLAPSVGLQEIPQQPIDPGILATGLNPSQFGFAVNVPPRRIYQKGARSLQWTAEV